MEEKYEEAIIAIAIATAVAVGLIAFQPWRAPRKPKPKQGTISVSTTPTGAKVYVGGAYIGTAPVSTNVDPGTYTVKAVYQGQSKTQSVTVNERQTSTVSFTFGQEFWSFESMPSGWVTTAGVTLEDVDDDGDKELTAMDDTKNQYAITQYGSFSYLKLTYTAGFDSDGERETFESKSVVLGVRARNTKRPRNANHIGFLLNREPDYYGETLNNISMDETSEHLLLAQKEIPGSESVKMMVIVDGTSYTMKCDADGDGTYEFQISASGTVTTGEYLGMIDIDDDEWIDDLTIVELR